MLGLIHINKMAADGRNDAHLLLELLTEYLLIWLFDNI